MTHPAPPRSPRAIPVAVVATGLALVVGLVIGLRALLPRPPAEATAERAQDDPVTASAVVSMTPRAPSATAPAANPEDPGIVLARSLVARLAELFMPGRTLSDEERREIEAIERRLMSLGDAAVTAVIARLDAGKDAPGGQELLFNVLRKMPGEAVERRLVSEAKRRGQPTMRTMAIESLAARPTEGALTALGDIARNDPELPARALITTPRDPSDTSTELPDETVFSPRMQAMSALAATRDPRAVPVLTDVVKTGPDEALRMEAARNLEALRTDPRAGEVLRAAAASDPSAYVRLAALHSLQGSSDPSLPALLEGIAARDRDAGVRLLAKQLLAELRR